nr:hypothetical protein [Tanacetum cinerariifolium]
MTYVPAVFLSCFDTAEGRYKTDEELTEKEVKQMESNDQATQTILIGNQNRYNAIQNARNRVGQNVVQNPDKVLQLQRIGSLCQELHSQTKEKGCCLSLDSVIDSQKEKVGIQLQAEELYLMASACDIDEIEKVNANCILMANLQQASTSEEQYTDLLEPITEPHPIQQNTSNVIITKPSVEHNESTVEQYPAIVEETHDYFESLYNNLVTEVEKVNKNNKFEKQFLKEAAKFMGGFKSLAKEADESLDMNKGLEYENERLLRAVVRQNSLSSLQNNSIVDTSNLQTELERTKEKFESCITKKENEYAKLCNYCSFTRNVRIFEQETWDLDVEFEQLKELKAFTA